MLCVSRITESSRFRTAGTYKLASSWEGFWITPSDQVFYGEESHQEILDQLGPDNTYDDAFDKGWIRGYIQSGEAGFEARSIVRAFQVIQNLVQQAKQRTRIQEVNLDLNGSAYSIPTDDFLSMNTSREIRPYKVSA